MLLLTAYGTVTIETGRDPAATVAVVMGVSAPFTPIVYCETVLL